ncbi:MAG TPA: nicotinate (nicotinamide) nucleotide adenylyltransferase [Acidisarcina sp.]
MRIAFFGGSFDPPHRGHLAIARAAAKRLNLDQVVFAPVGRQPLKHAAADAPSSSYEARCAMVELAIAGEPGMTLSLIDAPKPGGEPNYTIKTLRQLSATLAPSDELYCLLGADSFLTLGQWRGATELLRSYKFIVASRPGFALADLAGALPDPFAGGVTRIQHDESAAGYQIFCACERTEEGDGDSNGEASQANIYVLPDLEENISATQIRSALAEGTVGDNLLLPSVVSYIKERGLYRQ